VSLFWSNRLRLSVRVLYSTVVVSSLVVYLLSTVLSFPPRKILLCFLWFSILGIDGTRALAFFHSSQAGLMTPPFCMMVHDLPPITGCEETTCPPPSLCVCIVPLLALFPSVLSSRTSISFLFLLRTDPPGFAPASARWRMSGYSFLASGLLGTNYFLRPAAADPVRVPGRWYLPRKVLTRNSFATPAS